LHIDQAKPNSDRTHEIPSGLLLSEVHTMKSLFYLFVLLALLSSLLLPQSGLASRKIRIAWLGNTLAATEESGQHSSPGQLQLLLGTQYEVREFRGGGTTVHRDLSSSNRQEFQEARAYLPDIVFILPDLRDGMPVIQLTPDLDKSYESLVASFRQTTPLPRIILLLPPPIFSPDTAVPEHGANREHLLAAVRLAAYTTGSEVINLYNYLIDRPDLFPDGIHLSPVGTRLIASRLREAVTMQDVPVFDIVKRSGIVAHKSNYYGFECYDFAFDGRDAKIVRPKKAAPGLPWLWRARFWGHEPQTEIALLERGFHIAYCDVAELFGNESAIVRWNRFYEMLVGAGLAKKPALEAFSRGGIYAYRWAAANPERVACVYADAPVLDLKSWPGAKGSGAGNRVEWERFKQDYNFTEDEAIAFNGNPLDLSPQIARAGFPMFHVCGDSDPVVPIEENTDPFEKKIRASGGTITVIRKPGVGHHPHSLPNPEPIVEFILHASVQK